MYDLAIIGAGAAGIAAAKSALKANLKTLVIDQSPESFGGTCLNSGCIPAKFFINASQQGKSWEEISDQSKKTIEKIKLPLLDFLKKQGLDFLWEEVSLEDERIKAKNIIIATGSRPKSIIKHPKVIFAEEIFTQDDLGNKILVVGAGYIGMECATLLANFGKEVLVIEKEDRILSGFDPYLASRLKVILAKSGIKIKTNQNFADYNLDDFDKVISAVGRVPNLEKLKGLTLTKEGWIKTDKSMKTNIKNVYACGDATGKRLLAYVAEYQAEICLKNIIGTKTFEDYNGLPECVFSLPQIAACGIKEEEAKEANIKYRVIKSNFLKFSSSYVYDDKDGFIKIIVDQNEKIIGVGIISQKASELINLFALCLKNNLSLADLKKCLFVHPTISEIVPLILE
jgi:dihydrolipoamide dehydrogenase